MDTAPTHAAYGYSRDDDPYDLLCRVAADERVDARTRRLAQIGLEVIALNTLLELQRRPAEGTA